MTAEEEPYRLNPAESEAFQSLLSELTVEQLRDLQRDPDAVQALGNKARLLVALDQLDDDQRAVVASNYFAAVYGPLFTDEEWELIFEDLGLADLRDNPEKRANFELGLRNDAAALGSIKSLMTGAIKARESTLSPMAKQWLLRIGIGLIVGLIVLANQR